MQRPHAARLTRAIGPAWIVVLTVLILAPTLAPGFTLSYDLVFTPRQSLTWGSLGLGGGLPRAVPQDAVVALAEYVIPGMLLEKIVLVAIPLLAGFGMLRLLRDSGQGARCVAATLAVVTPYVAERLVIGHWGLLLAYAVSAWALDAARSARRGSGRGALTMLLWMALGSLTPSGAILLFLLVVPVAVGPRSALSWLQRWAICASALLLLLPWVLPSLLHPAGFANPSPTADVFALRSEGWGGALLTAVSGGGIWNAQVVPTSRGWIIAPIVALLLLALTIVGWSRLHATLGRAVTWWWTALAVAGLLAAVVSAWWPQTWSHVILALPGGGLLRDSQKLLAPLVLLVAAGTGAAVGGLAARIRDMGLRRTVVGACLLLPLVVLPDIAWGVGGRLGVATYPDAWQQARAVLAEDPRPGDVAVLPWSTFRRFPWNAGRTMLDPAPRWLPRPTVVADSLAVATPNGIVVVPGDDPRAQAVGTALADGNLPELARLGIGWVLVEQQSGALPPATAASPAAAPVAAPDGVVPVMVGEAVELYAVPGDIAVPGPPTGATLVAAVNGAALAGLIALLVLRLGAAWRRRRASAGA